jgi:hypothetical protein
MLGGYHYKGLTPDGSQAGFHNEKSMGITLSDTQINGMIPTSRIILLILTQVRTGPM